MESGQGGKSWQKSFRMGYSGNEDSRKQVSTTQVKEQTGLIHGLEVNDIEAKRYGQALTWVSRGKLKEDKVLGGEINSIGQIHCFCNAYKVYQERVEQK